MKKKYIFIYGSISGLGGRQLYLQRKSQFLIANGWDVYILTGNNTNVVLEDLKTVKTYMIKELKYPIFYFSGCQIQQILQRCHSFIGLDSEELYIESQDLNEAFWGEHLAEYYGTTNMVYIIGEPRLKDYNLFYRDFYLKKVLNNECVGVTEFTLRILLKDVLEEGQYNNNYLNIPFDRNEIKVENNILNRYIEDIEEDFIKIFTIARLEKEYIIELLNAVLSIALQEKNKRIALIIVGGSTNFPKLIHEYRKKYEKNNSNLIIRFTDNQNPISPSLFRRMDIFVGMGTAAINAISQSCPTVCVNPLTLKSTGILGITTTNFGFNDEDKEEDITKVISELINNKELMLLASKKGLELFEEFYDNETVNNKAIEYIHSIQQSTYWTNTSYDDLLGLGDFRKVLFKTLGINKYEYLSGFNKSIVKHFKLFITVKR